MSPDQTQAAFLAQYGFDQQLFAGWRAAVAAGKLSRAGNAVTSPLLPPPRGALAELPRHDSQACRDLQRRGDAAIAAGQLGIVVLNGGMATRFGGVVKGVVEVLGKDRSFLGLVAEDIRRAQRETGGRIALFLMNSFATDELTKAHLRQHDDFGLEPGQVHHFTQFVSLRMAPDGAVFELPSGEVSPYGPGHGDFAAAFRRSCLRQFLAQGGRHLLVRNVDNVGARSSALLLGHHLQSGAEVTVELAPKRPEDVGGAPYLLDGRLQLVEQLRYPPGFDHRIVPVFNTNTFTFAAAALDRDFELGWYYVEKEVEGKKAVQVERLIGEMTAHLRCNWLQVSRTGRDNRFLPVKTPEDLAAGRAEIAAMYGPGPQV